MALKPSGRTPDWDVVILDKDTQEKGRVGAAWTNEDESISIVLNPCVVLTARKALNVRLFKKTDYTAIPPRPKSTTSKDPSAEKDDCPF